MGIKCSVDFDFSIDEFEGYSVQKNNKFFNDKELIDIENEYNIDLDNIVDKLIDIIPTIKKEISVKCDNNLYMIIGSPSSIRPTSYTYHKSESDMFCDFWCYPEDNKGNPYDWKLKLTFLGTAKAYYL